MLRLLVCRQLSNTWNIPGLNLSGWGRKALHSFSTESDFPRLYCWSPLHSSKRTSSPMDFVYLQGAHQLEQKHMASSLTPVHHVSCEHLRAFRRTRPDRKNRYQLVNWLRSTMHAACPADIKVWLIDRCRSCLPLHDRGRR